MAVKIKVGYMDGKGRVRETEVEPTWNYKTLAEARVTFEVAVPDQVEADQIESFVRWKLSSGCPLSCKLTEFEFEDTFQTFRE